MQALESFVYHSRDGHVLIEIVLEDIRQLFNTFDPAPFHQRDMDDDAEAYIVGAAREIARDHPLILTIHLPAEKIRPDDAKLVTDTVHNYFTYKTHVARQDLRYKFRQGWDSLLVGGLFLFACLSLQQMLKPWHPDSTFVDAIREGLMISGWVAMWRPIQIFLYDWRPIYHDLHIYQKLSRVQVEIQPKMSTAAPAATSVP